ncbi:MAG: FeoB small GTPase domain-containing protein, partial [bacterium]|nr:FeoB small GTPase domain-containing protein [bacterium]
MKKLILLGNPNVGKSVLFGFLTGRYVQVSNYPGTTIEITNSVADWEGEKISLTDTPGVNSLLPMSEEEVVTRDMLLREKTDGVIQVADAKNLRRSLMLTLQLSEMGVPFLLDLNMEDESTARGIIIDRKRLETFLGVPVV